MQCRTHLPNKNNPLVSFSIRSIILHVKKFCGVTNIYMEVRPRYMYNVMLPIKKPLVTNPNPYRSHPQSLPPLKRSSFSNQRTLSYTLPSIHLTNTSALPLNPIILFSFPLYFPILYHKPLSSALRHTSSLRAAASNQESGYVGMK